MDPLLWAYYAVVCLTLNSPAKYVRTYVCMYVPALIVPLCREREGERERERERGREREREGERGREKEKEEREREGERD